MTASSASRRMITVQSASLRTDLRPFQASVKETIRIITSPLTCT